jgi:cell fate (sporulation/competence/biofilm development) regulator YlbF (YheA/YmcA/DUF963 family)
MANVYDTANQMAADIKTTQEFQDLKKALDLLKLDTVAYGLFQQFQQKQYEMQQKSMQGQDFTDEEVKSLQALGDKMRDIQPIQNLMAKEQGLSQMMDELNKIISQPIIDVYQSKP